MSRGLFLWHGPKVLSVMALSDRVTTTSWELSKWCTLPCRFKLLYDAEFSLFWFSHLLAALVGVWCHPKRMPIFSFRGGRVEAFASETQATFVCATKPEAHQQSASSQWDGGLHVPFTVETMEPRNLKHAHRLSHFVPKYNSQSSISSFSGPFSF